MERWLDHCFNLFVRFSASTLIAECRKDGISIIKYLLSGARETLITLSTLGFSYVWHRRIVVVVGLKYVIRT